MIDVLQILENAAIVIGIASAVSPIIPSPKYNKYLIVAKSLLDIIAFNFGHAKNKSITPEADPVPEK